MALNRARYCVRRLVENRATLAASEHAQFVRVTARTLCA